MIIKVKLRAIGNSWGVILPKDVITQLVPNEVITIDVITPPLKDVITEDVITDVITPKEPDVITPVITGYQTTTPPVITPPEGKQSDKQKSHFNTAMCAKHKGSMMGSCGCK